MLQLKYFVSIQYLRVFILPACNTSVQGILTFVSASIKLALWRDRCNIVFRGAGRPADVVLAAVRAEVKLRVESDFVRLPRSVFGRRWGPLVSVRVDRVVVHL